MIRNSDSKFSFDTDRVADAIPQVLIRPDDDPDLVVEDEGVVIEDEDDGEDDSD